MSDLRSLYLALSGLGIPYTVEYKGRLQILTDDRGFKYYFDCDGNYANEEEIWEEVAE